MLPEVIKDSPDLLRLKQEGLELEIIDGFLLIHSVPLVNGKCQITRGTLVCILDRAGNKAIQPKTHVMHSIGDAPCDIHGQELMNIYSGKSVQDLGNGIVIEHSYSTKPPCGYYKDYYEKVTHYVGVISAPAKELDPTVTEKTFRVIESDDPACVFNYVDSNSARAKIGSISAKLAGHKIAIIGLGGTGSYVLDFLAKTPVAEIHVFDGDTFGQHNAFRSPGAPSIEDLMKQEKKVERHAGIYSAMRKGIISHPYHVTSENVSELESINFVFICGDDGPSKKVIVDYLRPRKKQFIDVGIGMYLKHDKLAGHIRTTLFDGERGDHLESSIDFAIAGEDAYSTNIQIAELNALNAVHAVIKWKKLLGFYQDFSGEIHTLYSINDGKLFNEDFSTGVC